MSHRPPDPLFNDRDVVESTPPDSSGGASALNGCLRLPQGNRVSLLVLSLVATATTAGCGAESTQILLADPAASDTTAEIVASRMDLARIADVASDPLVIELLGELPPATANHASGAVEDFGTKVLAAPAESFKGLETALIGLDQENEFGGEGEESDADIAREVLDLYLDWSHVTLFGTEPDSDPSPR